MLVRASADFEEVRRRSTRILYDVLRVHREARAAARLRHPNVVPIYEVGEDEDRPYFAMEYVDGLDLARMVKAKGPLPVETRMLPVSGSITLPGRPQIAE